MEYAERILKVLIYIENHFEEDILLQDLAKIAHYSPFHFHRIFHLVVGETPHKYVRRLKLEKAAKKLCYSDNLITDIALDASFDTSSSFTKAFKQYMGDTPKNYRAMNKEITMVNQKITDLENIKPETISNIKSIPVYFVRSTGDYAHSSQAAWGKMMEFIQKNQLNEKNLRFLSITHDDPKITSEEKLRFDACIQTEENLPLEKQTIKGGRYAKFRHEGPSYNIDQTYERIFLKWLPLSNEQFDDNRSCFCDHLNVEYSDIDESKLVTEIYIPI